MFKYVFLLAILTSCQLPSTEHSLAASQSIENRDALADWNLKNQKWESIYRYSFPQNFSFPLTEKDENRMDAYEGFEHTISQKKRGFLTRSLWRLGFDKLTSLPHGEHKAEGANISVSEKSIRIQSGVEKVEIGYITDPVLYMLVSGKTKTEAAFSTAFMPFALSQDTTDPDLQFAGITSAQNALIMELIEIILPISLHFKWIDNAFAKSIKDDCLFTLSDTSIYAHNLFLNDLKLNEITEKASKFLESQPGMSYVFNDHENKLILTNSYKTSDGFELKNSAQQYFISKNDQGITFAIPRKQSSNELLIIVLPHDEYQNRFAWRIDLKDAKKSQTYGKLNGEFLRLNFDLLLIEDELRL